MRDLAAHRDAVKAQLVTTGRDLFTYREIGRIQVEERPENYLLFDVSRVYGGEQMHDGTTAASLWRIGTRAVASDEDNAATLLDDCRAALEGRQLLIAGEPTGPIEFESATDIDDDDGKAAGLIDWTYDHS